MIYSGRNPRAPRLQGMAFYQFHKDSMIENFFWIFVEFYEKVFEARKKAATLSHHGAPSRVHSMPGAFDRGNYNRTTSGLLREPSICSDALTRDIFTNIEETLNKGRFPLSKNLQRSVFFIGKNFEKQFGNIFPVFKINI